MTAIGDVEVRDEKDNLIAKGLATYAIFKKSQIKNAFLGPYLLFSDNML